MSDPREDEDLRDEDDDRGETTEDMRARWARESEDNAPPNETFADSVASFFGLWGR